MHVFTMTGPNDVPTLVQLRWVKYADFLLFPDRDNALTHQPKGIGAALNSATEDVERLAQRARHHQVRIVEGPINRPWNICEPVLLDPDGYRLVFDSPRLDRKPQIFDRIVASAAKGFKDEGLPIRWAGRLIRHTPDSHYALDGLAANTRTGAGRLATRPAPARAGYAHRWAAPLVRCFCSVTRAT